MLPTSAGRSALYRSSDGRLVAFSSGSEEPPAVAEEEPDSDDFDPWPPLPHEQAGLPTQERCTQTLSQHMLAYDALFGKLKFRFVIETSQICACGLRNIT